MLKDLHLLARGVYMLPGMLGGAADLDKMPFARCEKKLADEVLESSKCELVENFHLDFALLPR